MDWTLFIDYAVKAAFILLGGVVSVIVIPWLKEKRIYGLVKQFVQSAEKWAETHDINKKQFVIDLLTDKGVKITPVIEALIESAVQELDIALGKTNQLAE